MTEETHSALVCSNLFVLRFINYIVFFSHFFKNYVSPYIQAMNILFKPVFDENYLLWIRE